MPSEKSGVHMMGALAKTPIHGRITLSGYEGSELLAKAIRATFEQRGMAVPGALPIGLSDEFAHDPSRQALWLTFLKKNDLAPEPLPAVVERLRVALAPALNTVGR